MLIVALILVIIYTFILRKILLKKNIRYLYYREIPNNDAPALIGKIVKGHADGNDIIATILDLSYRGYIKIDKEIINGKEREVLYLQKIAGTTELQEHEMFLINQIFKNNNRIVFDEYIRSINFRKDFKTFDKMLDRRIQRKTIYNNSSIKNINKVLLLINYFMFGICVLYSLILPIMCSINSFLKLDIKSVITINIVFSGLLHLFISYRYITYIERTTNARENINLSIGYLILSMVLGCFIILKKYDNMFSIFYEELIWYKIIVNFLISMVTILYMFNIIKHTEKQEYLYYIFLIVSLLAIMLDMKIAMGISIIFFIIYIFFKSPKHSNLKEEDDIYKWIALKKYLEDYSMLSQQERNAMLIWEKYFIYAVSLGINKKILKKYAQLNDIRLLNEEFLKKNYVEYFE